MSRSILFVCLGFVTALTVEGCKDGEGGGDGGSETGDQCQAGTLLCECLGGTVCDGDLVCEDGYCVNPPSGEGSSADDSSGGDATADGGTSADDTTSGGGSDSTGTGSTTDSTTAGTDSGSTAGTGTDSGSTGTTGTDWGGTTGAGTDSTTSGTTGTTAGDTMGATGTTGTTGTTGGVCQVFAGMAADDQPSRWAHGGFIGSFAGDSMCTASGADHFCTYQELLTAEAQGELVGVTPGTTAWVSRYTTAMTYPPGAGGRCNDWTYWAPQMGNCHNGALDANECDMANQAYCAHDCEPFADGEWVEFGQAGATTYHLDPDTCYTGTPGCSEGAAVLPCFGIERSVPCCFDCS